MIRTRLSRAPSRLGRRWSGLVADQPYGCAWDGLLIRSGIIGRLASRWRKGPVGPDAAILRPGHYAIGVGARWAPKNTVGRTLLSAAVGVGFVLRSPSGRQEINIQVNGGGQECPPYTPIAFAPFRTESMERWKSCEPWHSAAGRPYEVSSLADCEFRLDIMPFGGSFTVGRTITGICSKKESHYRKIA